MGNERVYLKGLYQMSAGGLVALDWEQPAVENSESREGMNGIACICGNFPAAFGTSRGWHCAWVFLQCKICVGRYYCSPANWYGECVQCQQLPDQADLESRILKLVCGKSHLVPEWWAMQEDWERTVQICGASFRWK